MSALDPSLPRSLAALRRFAQASTERCELCGTPVVGGHEHLLDPGPFTLKCACGRCAVLFSSGSARVGRRVPPRVERVAPAVPSDAAWELLGLPIALAYFVRRSSEGRVVAYYPGPAGATESRPSVEAWSQLEAACPWLASLPEDVEALLVNRVGGAREAYRVSIDHCFSLVGVIRSSWRGLSGGAEVWSRVGEFWARLGASAHA